MPLPAGTAAVVLDIEGTTTPITFVHDVLFPYAERRLEDACRRAADDPEIAEAVAELRREYASEPEDGRPDFGDGAPYARYLMGQDRKSTGLKRLQGIIWEDGYRSGELRATVFADVPPALAAWQRQSVRLRIYSSGSVLAQRLLFGHTDHGDLTPFFEGYHDTTTGPKKEADSYRAIAESLALPASRILFLSDVAAELDAAAEAGLMTGLVLRPGNQPVTGQAHPRYADFTDLC